MLYLSTGAVHVFLDTMEKIRLVIPRVKEIWEHSTLLQDLSVGKLRETLQKEKDIRKSIAKGKLTMDSVVGESLEPVA